MAHFSTAAPERGHNRVLAGWLAAFRLARRYHRYEVRGLAWLDGPRAQLIVGYHGRPLAIDQCILTVEIYERLGYLPHGVIHGHFRQNRLLSWLVDGLGFVTGDSPELAAAVARGEHILVQPGGVREGCRSFRQRHRVDWGPRTGYLKLAIKYGLPIVPVAARGADDLFFGLNDGYRLGKRLAMPGRLPLWLGLGMFGPWPLALPFPVKLEQSIGRPIEEHLGCDPDDPVQLGELHRLVQARVQALLAEGHTSASREGAQHV